MNLNQDFVNELRKQFTGDILLDLGSRILYSTDASIYQIEPLGIVIPRTEEDLHSAVELASEYKIPVLPRGSGTSLAGQSIGEALLLDCSRWLDRIINIEPESRTATIQPGVILSKLNRAAADFGLQFGPDPASAERATLGGVIANNATGAHSISYGMTADHLLSAEVIHSDGSLASWGELEIGHFNTESTSVHSRIVSAALEIRAKYSNAIKDHYPRSWRNSAGYRLNYLLPWSPSTPPNWIHNEYPSLKENTINLANLLAGSEGTLGIIRQASISLVAKPKHAILGILNFNNLTEACDAVPDLLKFNPSAIELIPELILRLARGIPAYARLMDWLTPMRASGGDPKAILVVEFSGDFPAQLINAVKLLGPNVVIIESVEEQEHVWTIRKVGLGILDSRPRSARPVAFIEDCAIPVERLGVFVQEIEKILSEHGTMGGIYAHASAGCLHVKPLLDLRTGEGVRFLREIAEQTLSLALRLGGSMVSEHGDGIARGEWLGQTYGVELITAMRLLKNAADPNNLLNPQKMFDAPPMDSHLRFGGKYEVKAWSPAVDFNIGGGIVTAIEQCNGQGVCRKDTGVMCPSFQATRDEKFSTRGRANLLRSMIMTNSSWHMPGSRINETVVLRKQDLTASPISTDNEMSKIVFESLDLCLACKGCKAECPSGVDMAKLKFAFMAEYYKNHRRLIRDYLFGFFHITASFLSSIAPVVNFLMSLNPIKQFVTRSMSITANRPFPLFAKKYAKIKLLTGSPKVLFLRDPFTHFIEPGIEQAAFNVLFSMGFDVEVITILGAGASLMSKGFIQAARHHAERILKELKKKNLTNFAAIVGIEPSELYFLKHDYLDLFPARSTEIAEIASKTWLLEEFLIRSSKINDLRIATNGKKIFLHPHCHQEAEYLSDDGLSNGSNATVELLEKAGYEIELTKAGCCGMAGTFGYEKEHFDLSQQIGNLKLFPLLKKFGDDHLIAATGAACRMQIFQGTGISAQHPIQLVELALSSHDPTISD